MSRAGARLKYVLRTELVFFRRFNWLRVPAFLNVHAALFIRFISPA